MAYFNPRFQQQYIPPTQSGDDKALSVDWDVRKIPGQCYRACILSRTQVVLARGGAAHVQKAMLTFKADLDAFYMSIAPEFNKYLLLDEYTKNAKVPKPSLNKLYAQEDFESLAFIDYETQPGHFKKLSDLFIIMCLWCVFNGPFRTFNEIGEDESQDVFEKIEDELA